MPVPPAARRCLLATLALSALAFTLHPAWARSAGVDVWELPGLRRQLREADDEDRRLAAENAELMRCLRAKEAVVADLLRGRMTLAGAADRFGALNESYPACAAQLRGHYPGATDREKCARNVIDYALHRAPPHEEAAARARLEAELRQMLTAGR